MTQRKIDNPTAEASRHATKGKPRSNPSSAKQAKPSRGKGGPEPTSAQATSAEPSPVVTPAATSSAPKTKTRVKSGRMSALDAAAKVLAEASQPMSCQEMIDAMAKKNYWSSPGGRTPAATLYSAILRELKTKADQSRFVKSERGKFSRR